MVPETIVTRTFRTGFEGPHLGLGSVLRGPKPRTGDLGKNQFLQVFIFFLVHKTSEIIISCVVFQSAFVENVKIMIFQAIDEWNPKNQRAHSFFSELLT